MTTTKQRILDAVNDLGSNFMYYDRKNDEDLPLGVIDDALAYGEITVDEIVEAFREAIDG